MKNLKRFFVSISLIGVIAGFSSFDYGYIEKEVVENSLIACKIGQCTAIAKSTGQRCKHCVSKAGDTKCWQHK